MTKTWFSAVPVGARRAFVAFVAVLVTAISMMGSAPSAQAQQNSQIEQISSQLNSLSSDLSVEKLAARSRDDAWNLRNKWLSDLRKLNPQAETIIRPAIDNAMNAIFPGLKAEKQREERLAREAAARKLAAEQARERAIAEEAARRAEAERRRNSFNVGPCPRDAKVCVDIDGRRTWLQDGKGGVTYVAPAMAPGRPGQDTPRGTFYVNRKVKDEISYEFNNAPMPWAVYFTYNGHAFHQGDPSFMSAGCVRLPADAAQRFFNTLQIGDKVFIY